MPRWIFQIWDGSQARRDARFWNPLTPSEHRQPHRFRGRCTRAKPPRVESHTLSAVLLARLRLRAFWRSCLYTGIPHLRSAASNPRCSKHHKPGIIRTSPPSRVHSTSCLGLRARRVSRSGATDFGSSPNTLSWHGRPRLPVDVRSCSARGHGEESAQAQRRRAPRQQQGGALREAGSANPSPGYRALTTLHRACEKKTQRKKERALGIFALRFAYLSCENG